jgi:hypothetical protein
LRRSYRLSCEEEKKDEKRDLIKAEIEEFKRGSREKKEHERKREQQTYFWRRGEDQQHGSIQRQNPFSF